MSKADKLKKKATEFEAKRQTDKAIAAYLDLFREWESDPSADVDVAIYNRVGDMLLKSGNVGDAMTVWEKAVDYYGEGGFHNNAIALCNKILRNSPGRAAVYYKLGKISAQKGFRGDARKNYLEYADRMQKSGQIDEAFRALKEFADLSPDDNDIRQMLADQLLKIGRSDEAIEQLQMLYEGQESDGNAAAAEATMARMRAIDPAVEPKRSGPRSESAPSGLVFINVDEPAAPSARKSTASPPPPPPATPKRGSSTSKFVTDAKTITATQGLPLIDLEDEPPPPPPPPPVVEPEPEPIIDASMPAIPAPVEEPVLSILEEAPVIVPEVTVPSILEEATPLIVPEEETVPSILDEAPAVIPEEVVPSILDEAPMIIDEVAPPAIVEEEPVTVQDEALPSILEEAPMIIDDVAPPPIIEEEPVIPEEAPVIIEEEPVIAEEEPLIADEEPVIADEVPVVIDEEPVIVEEVRPVTPAAPPPRITRTPADMPLVMPDISFEESFGTSEPSAPTAPVSEFGAAPGGDLRVSASLSQPEDLTFGSGDVEPFSSGAGDENPFGLVNDEPIEFGTSSAAIGTDSSIVFEGFDDAMIAAPTAGEMTEEEAPAPREQIQRKSMRPTMSALAMSVDSLREKVRADVTNWHLRRQFAEALLEDGDREGGLEELETAMVGYERATDYESARSVAEEIIRLQPLSVRHHQKRVEYSYRMNDRVRLIDAYLDLADALFREGEAEKSKVVYERVLDLAPDDVRAIAAMTAFSPQSSPAVEAPDASATDDEPFLTDADLEDPPEESPLRPSLESAIDESFRASLMTPAVPVEAVPDPVVEPKPETERDRPFADTFKPRITPYVVTPVPSTPRVSGSVPKVPEPKKPSEPSSDFVDLEDWLKEDEGPKSTRMVIPEQAPTGDETADFNDMLRKFKQGVAKNVDDEDHESHYDLGVAFKEMGLIEEAIAEFQKALRSPAHRVRTYEALGQCFLDKSQEQVAVTILQRALSEPGAGDDKLIGVLYLLGVSSEAIGQPREAVKYYQRVFAVDINFRDVRKRMREIEQAAR